MRLLVVASFYAAVALSVVGCSTFGADPESENSTSTDPFETVYGTGGTDEATGLLELGGGDLLVVGNGNGVGAPADGTLPTPSLTRLNSRGTILWSQVYDSLRYAHGDAVAAIDGGFAIYISRSDEREAFGGGIEEVMVGVWFVQEDGQLGRRLFRRTSASVYDSVRPMTRTSDGNLVLFGQDRADDGTLGSWFITKINYEGARIWETVVSYPADFVQILEGQDGTIFLTGAVGRPGGERPFLLALSSNGDVITTLTLPRDGGSAVAMAVSGDDRFAFVARTSTGDQNEVFVTDANGSLIHVEAAGSSSTRWLAAAAAPAGGWLLTGTADSATPDNARELAYARLDPDGATLDYFQYSYHPRLGTGHDVLPLSDGRIAVAGTLCPAELTFGGPDCDAIVRTVPGGEE